MTIAHTLAAVADERFVSLTTFRRSGEPVSTPVWVAQDGDALIVTTPADSGKVKRLCNNPRVELRPSDRMGGVKDDAVTVAGRVEIVSEEQHIKRLTSNIRRKYGLEYWIIMGIERLANIGREKDRLILRITDVEEGNGPSPAL
ncbi:MAG TPA: PPOX class F420-dependent oxidoreductase [Roseiflexaceae bacterium]|nr:PPOX class F420-dependent oxidoreductase [Roseiflexaceae bacterium]